MGAQTTTFGEAIDVSDPNTPGAGDPRSGGWSPPPPQQPPGPWAPAPSGQPPQPPAWGQPGSGQPPAQPPGGQPPGGQYPGQQPGQPGQWGPEPAPPKKGGKGLVIALVALVVVALVGAGLAVLAVSSGDDDADGGDDTASAEVSNEFGERSRPEHGEEPENLDDYVVQGGDPSDEAQQVVVIAIADVDAFWEKTYPEVYGDDYVTVEGGLYAADGSEPIPCTTSPDDVAGNAFYCPSDDVVAWDAVGLIPDLLDTYGELGIGLVLAHEWGHAVQARAGTDGATVYLEQQADCFAGAWVDDVRDDGDRWFQIDDAKLDTAMAGFLALRDQPGTSAADPSAHGTAFDRIRAFQDGVDGGAEACAAYEQSSLPLVDLPFTSEEDLASGGNLPLQDAYDLAVADLEDFWTLAWGDVFEGSFEAPEVELYDEGDEPDCRGGAVVLSEDVSYCAASDTLLVGTGGIVVKAHNSIGDFALAELLGAGYALSALDQLGQLEESSPRQTTTADCLSGVWAASVWNQDRETASLILSPGDLDEAVSVLLATAEHGKGSTTGTGFDRVAAYRDGFMDGVGACDL